MKHHACDQIATDILETNATYSCSLEYKVVISVMEYVARHYRPGNELDFENLLDTGLDRFEPMTDHERHAYKYVLGIIYYRRVQAQRGKLRELDRSRPFAPR